MAITTQLPQSALAAAASAAKSVSAQVLPSGATKIIVRAGDEDVEMHIGENFAHIRYNNEATEVASNATTRGLQMHAQALAKHPENEAANDVVLNRTLAYGRNFARSQTQIA